MDVRLNDPFDTMLQHYRGLLYTLCSRYRRRGLEAEDLLQEAAIALWRDSERLLSLPAVQQAAMVWKIARNAMIDHVRRSPESDPLPEDTERVDDSDRALLHDLHECIALLPEPDQTIVTMQLQGYSYQEIGEQLGMTEKNVSVRLVRAKERLRTAMTE